MCCQTKGKYLTRTEIQEIIKDHQAFNTWLDSQDGEEGAVLDLIGSIRDLDGEDATDGECLDLISDLLLMWRIERG